MGQTMATGPDTHQRSRRTTEHISDKKRKKTIEVTAEVKKMG